VDLSVAAVSAAKQVYGIDVFTGTVPEAPFADESFDVVTASHYLEHVPNPLEVLATIRRLLKPNGLCLIGTPNVASLNARIFRDCWFPLECPRHLYLYSPATIRRLLEKAGFAVDGIAFDPGTRGLLLSLRYRFGDERIPLSRRRKPTGLRLLKALARPWAWAAARLRQSDIMVVCARKAGVPRSGPCAANHGTAGGDCPPRSSADGH